jgi:ATP-dependent DNA ligase
VGLREDGRSDFAALMTKCGRFMASWIAFDLLRLEGVGLRERPIEKRREVLTRLIAEV